MDIKVRHMERWMAGLVVLGIIGCTPAIKVSYDSDPNADFRTFERFSWISDYPVIAPETDLLIEYRSQPVMQATRDVLSSKGYAFVDDRRQADFVVSFTMGDVGGQLVETAYPPEYQGRWYWRGPASCRPQESLSAYVSRPSIRREWGPHGFADVPRG